MKTKIRPVTPLEIVNEQKKRRLKPEDYAPEIWENLYMSNRYLSGLSISELENRHNEICNNLSVLEQRVDPNLSVDNVNSMWYWLSKEHTTRLEAFLKGAEFYLPSLNLRILQQDNIYLPYEYQNTFFKYGKTKHTLDIIEKGELLFHEASYYCNDNNQARRDDEKSKKQYINKEQVTLTLLKDGRKIEPISNITMIHEANFANYIFCVSSHFDDRFFRKFDAESCVVVTDRKEFERRLAMNIPVDKNIISFPVEYYDPWSNQDRGNIAPCIYKDFCFAWQCEYRFLIYNKIEEVNANPQESMKINLGSLEDISEYYVRSKK